MPYIEQKQRDQISAEGVHCIEPENCGELNYCITMLIHDYLLDREVRYKYINEVIGVLECAKLELYRQVAAPYENKKKLTNGAISKLDSVTLEDIR